MEAYALLEQSAHASFSGGLPFEQMNEAFVHLAELRAPIGVDPQR